MTTKRGMRSKSASHDRSYEDCMQMKPSTSKMKTLLVRNHHFKQSKIIHGCSADTDDFDEAIGWAITTPLIRP